MSAFVDRLARAGYSSAMRQAGYDPDEVDEFDKIWVESWRAYIRAILAEARDAVTDEMAAPIAYNYLIRDADLKIAFQAMIDAALAPDKVKP